MLGDIQCPHSATSSETHSSNGGANNNNNNGSQQLDPDSIIRRSAPICRPWTWFTESILHDSIKCMVVFLAVRAARYPYRTLFSMTFVSLAVLVTGFFTNFTLIVDSDEIYTPTHTLAEQHHDWLVRPYDAIDKETSGSGFNNIRPLLMILHQQGQNVATKDNVAKLFQAVDAVRNTPGYDELCEQGSYVSQDNQHTCRILSATRFWNHNETWFQRQVRNDDQLIDIMSRDTYQDDTTPVFHELMLGNYVMTNETLTYNATTNQVTHLYHNTSRLASVESLFVRMEFPDTVGEEADEFETRALDNLRQLQQEWQDEGEASDNINNPLQLDFLSIFAYKIENQRALIKDLPLVGGIFVILLIFTTLVFSKRHPVYSRGMLGCASLSAIGMSLALSYGIVWCIGIPFTNIAQILPFMIMGVGLDDTFIITGAYFRTNPDLTIERRIENTMNEVGLSISLTSITTMVAFVLGSMSSIPGVKWLCWYAFAAVFTDFFFQITFFVALLTLDERRLQSYRKSWCCWKSMPVDVDECESQMGVNLSSSMSNSGVDSITNTDDENPDVEKNASITNYAYKKNPAHVSLQCDTATSMVSQYDSSGDNSNKHFTERLMIWYGRQLMRPWCKVLVLVIFSAYFGFCCYRTTLLKQEFNVEDYTPADSYLRGTLQSLDDYYSLTKPLEVYFRGVNQSDPIIQQQMRDYVDEMAALPQIGEDAPFCWVRDFVNLQDQFPQYGFLKNLTFSQQLRAALTNPTIREIYGEDIVINEDTGEIEASRCLLFLRNVDLTNVNDQIDMLMGQREVTYGQPINQNEEDLKFFSFDTIFYYWELYAQAVDELIFTILSGVVAVTVVTFVLIPHWSSAFFVCPGIVIMYISFLGTMQWMGLHINSLTYVIIVMAIGLLVDFLVHILLRYYETMGVTREEKVLETLRTMGASMFIGGLTTFLGVCPLVLSSTHIFMTVFWAFLAIVVLGFTHGLILLPVVLSLIGPVATHQRKKEAVGFPADFDGQKVINASTSPGSTTSDKFDLQILQSSSEEELEEILQPNNYPEEFKDEVQPEPEEIKEQPDEKTTVPFLGPCLNLDCIEEGPNSTKSGPTSTTSVPQESSKSILPALVSPSEASRKLALHGSSLLGQLSDAYQCGAEFDFYNTAIQACKQQEPTTKP